MNDTAVGEASGVQDSSESDRSPSTSFSLKNIKVRHRDKLGHKILDILWCGSDYAVYCSERGIYVHFSDSPERERKQRECFTQISPILCELRFLTAQKISTKLLNKLLGFRSVSGGLFDHNIAQCLMLTMENQVEQAKRLAKLTLAMAVRKATNDNTIIYVGTCMVAAALWIIFAYSTKSIFFTGVRVNYCIASIFGAIGAAFSIITRVEAFEMKPCQQSNMNYLMSGIRVGIGIIGGVMLLLLGQTLAKGPIPLLDDTKAEYWKIAATFGFIGGFSERLIRSLLRQTADAVAAAPGTPVQELMKWEGSATIAALCDRMRQYEQSIPVVQEAETNHQTPTLRS